MIDEKIELAYYENKKGSKVSFTIKLYSEYLKDGANNREALSEFIFQRLYTRYLKPFEKNENNNGFSIMANCCLLIETLVSFQKGWESSEGRSKKSFEIFFKHDKELSLFQNDWEKFYDNVRCGILHQGETTGGFIIRRDGKLFDKPNRKINSKEFLKKLKKSLENYSINLESADWDDEIWDNFRRKMRSVISNCNNPNK